MNEDLLSEQVSRALVADVAPEHLESYNFSVGILPAFKLLHSLFYGDPVDTCLKLMVLFEVSRASGRFSIERIRGTAPFLSSDRVDAIVRSLKEGDWLDLRASDNTYTLSTIGLHLIGLLHAADLVHLSPTNALSRAAQNAAFRTTLDGADGITGYLLDQLLVVLENQVQDAKTVLQHGRPFRMIAWARREHRRQIETIQEVLATIEAHTDASSQHFTKVVRLHSAMQEIIRHRTSINTRLKDWNLDRLHASDTGYSISHLCESVMGIEDEGVLLSLLDDGTVQPMLVGPSLSTQEICVRFQGARRRLVSQQEIFEYAPPDMPDTELLSATEIDPAAELKARWSRLFADRASDAPLELHDWIQRASFSGVVYELTLLSRLQYAGDAIPLDDGRQVALKTYTNLAEAVSPGELLRFLEDQRALLRLETGLFSRVTLSILPPPTSTPGREAERTDG
jgi:hypothetical protein